MLVVDPTGVAAHDVEPRGSWRVDVRGRTVGILWNGKPNADNLLFELEKRLRDRFGVAHVVWANKGREAGGAALPATESIYQLLSAEAVAVITGSGDCGSCCSWTCRDAVELERRGVRTIVICTDAFQKMAELECSALELPGVQLGVIEHPLQGRDAAWIAVTADKLMPLLVERLGGGGVDVG